MIFKILRGGTGLKEVNFPKERLFLGFCLRRFGRYGAAGEEEFLGFGGLPGHMILHPSLREAFKPIMGRIVKADVTPGLFAFDPQMAVDFFDHAAVFQ